jgi:hypothetical protein
LASAFILNQARQILAGKLRVYKMKGINRRQTMSAPAREVQNYWPKALL